MKNIIKTLIILTAVSLFFTACHKEGDLPVYKTGNGVVVSGSASTVAVTAADLDVAAFTINWTWPNYATDSSNQKFVIQIAPEGSNFAEPVEFVYKGVTSAKFTGSQLNDLAFGFGVIKSEASNYDIRVISSYSNNNDLYKSNTISVSLTPFIVPVTLAIAPAGPLTLTMAEAANNAITCSWNATKYGNLPLSYAIQAQKTGGDWSAPIVTAFNDAVTGVYTVKNLNSLAVNLGIAPNTTESLDLRVIAYQGDFENPVLSNVVALTVTTYLDEVKFFVVGSYNGWDNSDNALTLHNSPTSGSVAVGYVYFPGSGEFKLTTDHSWDNAHTFGDDGTNSGKLVNPGSNIAIPEEGCYYITADIMAMTYTLTKTVWGIIGTSTPGGWGDQTNMNYFTDVKKYGLGIHLTAGEFKFRGTSDWSFNYGCTAGDGKTLDPGGSNIPLAVDDDYAITLDLSHPNDYTFSANRWGIIGSATAGGWDSDQNMTWDAGNGVFTATLTLSVGEFKYRANDGWDVNLGGSLTALEANGANIGISEAGTYKITLNPWTLVGTVTKL